MKLHILQKMATSFGLVCATFVISVTAQSQTAKSIPVIKQTEIARLDRRITKSRKPESLSSAKTKSKDFSYSYLLPFGVGQFERDKTILGTTLATAQAGFLLMYFERANAVRSSNADAADVMRGVNLSTASNDPALIAFLDQNESFTLKAQQQQNMAILGFFALYTTGVVEAVFDPIGKLLGKSSRGNDGIKKKRRESVNAPDSEDHSHLLQGLKEEPMQSRVGIFYQPDGTSGAVGLSLQKPL
jgi:hypothetical protein